MQLFLAFSLLLLGTSLTSSQPGQERGVKEEVEHLKEGLQHLETKLEKLERAFFTVHKARSFGSGSERLYITNGGEGDFETANSTCLAAGGHIPSPKKEPENQALQSVLKRHDKSAYVLGHNSVGYTNWAAGEPNNADGTKNCAETDKEGKWRAASCGGKHLIVCEFSFIP
ncbi:phospholipase A2 inhibitor alpha-like protein [Rhineura floridana]|uniref:phospholipase A2 inhibitor alpha-like protein n=1 Tax=Rhineura floridana TaxID=261503 RepID=UPI002AC880D0|nr:phospholipase A2 inhibitor alpha-like protein [Rhineura floridana]